MHKANRSQFQISNFEFEIQNPVPSRSLRVSLGVLCVFSFVESQRTQVRATARVEAEREPPRQPKRLPPLLRKEGSFSSAIHHSPFTIHHLLFFQRPNGRLDRLVIIAKRRLRLKHIPHKTYQTARFARFARSVGTECGRCGSLVAIPAS